MQEKEDTFQGSTSKLIGSPSFSITVEDRLCALKTEGTEARAKKSTSVTRSVTNPTPPPTPKDAEKNEQKSCAPKSEYTQEEKTAATDRKEKAEICVDQHFDECKTQLSEFRIEVKPSKEEKSAKTPGKGSGKLRSNKSWNERLKAKFESSSKRFKMRKKEKEEHPANHPTKSPMSRRLKTLAARMGGSKKDSGLQKNKVESKISAKDEKKVGKGSRVSKKEKRQERAKIVVPESDMPIDDDGYTKFEPTDAVCRPARAE